MGTDRAPWEDPDWPEALEEARAVLRAATEWQLREPRWRDVRDATNGVAAAVAAGDLPSLVEAVGQLERFGPLRVATRLGDPPRKPAPPEVRERINELIDALVPDNDPAPGDHGDSGQDPGRADDVSAG